MPVSVPKTVPAMSDTGKYAANKIQYPIIKLAAASCPVLCPTAPAMLKAM